MGYSEYITKVIARYRDRLAEVDPMPIVVHVRAAYACVCMDCDAVFDWRRRNGICPACGSIATMPLRTNQEASP